MKKDPLSITFLPFHVRKKVVSFRIFNKTGSLSIRIFEFTQSFSVIFDISRQYLKKIVWDNVKSIPWLYAVRQVRPPSNYTTKNRSIYATL